MREVPKKDEMIDENDAEDEKSEALDAFCSEVEEKGLEKSFRAHTKFCP